ncbi:MAG: hypothetical protein ACYCYI_02690 [Saccharofermentanales bacterium]
MDWLNEIGKFPPLDINESGLNISAKEAGQAIAKYDKALKNAQNDSLDIAIIELRKLVVLYPEMGQAAILLGCCQMQEEKPNEALKNFRKAGLASIPMEFSSSLNTYIEEAQKSIDFQLSNPEYKNNKARYPVESKPEIIVASPGNWKKIKVASRREKQEIMRSQSAPQVKETFVSERMDINWVKAGIITTAILLVLGIGALLYVYVPKVVDNIRNSGSKADTKLEWLLSQLNEKSSMNTDIKKILSDYDGTFYPTPEVTQEAVSKGTSEIAATPTITPTTAPTDNDKIVLAAHSVEQAQQIGKSDPKQVMVLLTQATAALTGIDEKATAPELSINAGEIMTEISQLMKNIVNAACFPYYRDGKVKMQAKEYAGAISLFQKAYDINPDYIDGGNAYNLGKAYAAAGQVANANKYFQYVIDNFPGSDFAVWASGRIKPTGEITE